MSLPASSYTPAGGGTIQGQQTAQTSNLLASAGSTGSPNINQLQQAAGNATQQLADMQTPQNRSAYLGNSNIPAQQNNYDSVARQLYQYDMSNLAPQYTTQPGQPTDAPAFGRVGPSSLFGLTPESAAGPMTLFANNPAYGISSQANQKNALLDVLNTLNSSLSKEFQAKRGTYASTVQSQKEVVSTLVDLLKNETDRQLRMSEMASSRAGKKDTATKEVWDQMFKDADTEDDIWKMINQNDAAWRGQGVDVDQLWAWHKDLASKVGYGGQIQLGLGEKAPISRAAKEDAKIKDNLAFLKDLKDVKNTIPTTGPFGLPTRNILGDILPGVGSYTGPQANAMGPYFLGSNTRAKINFLQARIKNKYYGSALSKYEGLASRTWVPDSNIQETTNLQRLNALIDSAENDIRIRLADRFTPQEIDQLLSEGLPDESTPAGIGGSNPLDKYVH